MPSYDESIKFLDGLHWLGIKLGLDRTEKLLSLLNDPHRAYRSIIVGGTNGKGSVSVMLASILTSAGRKAGLYTSPHLVRVNERIKIDGVEITDDELEKLVAHVREKTSEAELSPTYFEFLTIMAFEFFRQKGVDVAVLEVGMGGRLDSTNVVTPLASVITTIALDHEAILGRSLSEIAFEKAGIIKPGAPTITGVGEGESEALQVIERVAAERGSRLLRVGRGFNARPLGHDGIFDYLGGRVIKGLKTPLMGRHQMDNAAVAIAVIEALPGLGVGDQEIRDGLLGARWPGRLEVAGLDPMVLLDCAHNPAGARTLADALGEIDYRRLVLVFGCMADKDAEGMLSALLPLADNVIFTRVEGERAQAPESLAALSGGYAPRCAVAASSSDAIKRALALASTDDLVCIAGSIYLVGEAKKTLAGQGKESL